MRERCGRDGRDATSGEWRRHAVLASCAEVVRRRGRTRRNERRGGMGEGQDATLENYNSQSPTVPTLSTRSLSRG